MFKKKFKIAPSLLSANFTKLKDEILNVEAAGADLLHLDVMDGHFVPNLTIGPFIIEAIRECTKLPLDVHLMIGAPEKYIEAFIKAGGDMISFHCEAPTASPEIVAQIKKMGAKAGIAINPHTNISKLNDYFDVVDFVLVMSVYPGFGGQKFIDETLEKIKKLEKYRETHNHAFEIEVDGGINGANVSDLAKAGVDIFVAGSAIFKTADYRQTIAQMREKLNG
ncbi:MAG: ribulose-phosphate 3-epimerase [Deltaproteobacteria bacterium]